MLHDILLLRNIGSSIVLLYSFLLYFNYNYKGSINTFISICFFIFSVMLYILLFLHY